MSVRKSLEPGGLSDGYDTRLVRMQRSDRLVRTPVGAGSGTQGGAAARPRKSMMTTHGIVFALLDFSEASCDGLGMHGSSIAGEASIFRSQRPRVIGDLIRKLQIVNVEAVLIHADFARRGKIGDRILNGRTAVGSHFFDQREIGELFQHTDDEATGPVSGSAEVGRVEDGGAQYGVARRNSGHRGFQNLCRIALHDTDHVFHDEEARFHRSDETEEVMNEFPSRVGTVAFSDQTEPLAGRPPNQSVDWHADLRLQIGAGQCGYVCKSESYFGKVR